MRVVSVGDLVTDFYYNNSKIIGVDGGKSCHNIVINLNKLGPVSYTHLTMPKILRV